MEAIYEVTSPGGRVTRITATNSTSAKRKTLKFWGLSREFLKDCRAKNYGLEDLGVVLA